MENDKKRLLPGKTTQAKGENPARGQRSRFLGTTDDFSFKYKSHGNFRKNGGDAAGDSSSG